MLDGIRHEAHRGHPLHAVRLHSNPWCGMAQKKVPSSPKSKSTPRASSGKEAPVAPEVAWTGLEQQVLAALGKRRWASTPRTWSP
ncbi:hypothetical protein MFU01_80280 [Myxococcus fulvus]|uniref:Uncharacterized protein n=1 Tax=Myxococcus fulvus TaxID=33 RepID=A0A511TFR1_MYXFU|nr:hypothetical protein MFU01_80280 [Myxococcus fulvus]